MSGEGHTTGSRVTLHVVSSLDGFLARKNNSFSWVAVRSVGVLDTPLWYQISSPAEMPRSHSGGAA